MPTSRKRAKKKKFLKRKNITSANPEIKMPDRRVAPDPIKMKYFEADLGGWGDSTFEERLNALREVGKKAAQDFPAKYQALQDWFTRYDQLHILSFGFYYFMTSPAGYDEEAVTGELQFPPYYLELLQAFALTLPRSYDPQPFSREVDQFRKEFKEVGELNKFKYYDFPASVKSLDDVFKQQLRTEMMLHTTAVRNWSYEHKMKLVTLALAAAIREPFIAAHGFEPEIFLKVLYQMTEVVQERINGHRLKTMEIMRPKNYRGVIEAYEANFPVDKMPKDRQKDLWELVGKKLRNLQGMFLAHSDMFLPELLSFDYQTLEKYAGGRITASQFKVIMEKLSFEFGDLAKNNYEHFLLSNPIHEKPFIKITEHGIFTSLWSTMTHLSLGLLEKFCAEDKALDEKYSDARARYLEDQVAQLFKQSFPMAEIYAGSKWKGKDGKGYENDLLVIIGTFALVIEAKSGQVTPPAKRGAPDRLFKTLQQLIEEPAEQALRFIDYLKENPTELSLPVKKGHSNRFNAANLKYFIPLGVTLSHLGMMGANLKHLIKAGVTTKPIEDLAPSMSLTDLEVVFDLLPLAAEKIHYLQRRRELEANIEYMGDELDLLAWYFDNGFNLGPDEKKYGFFEVSSKSKELDNYIVGNANNEDVAKPGLNLTKWWRDMLSRMEEKQFQTWLENSYILLNIPIDAQELFEEQVGELKIIMMAGKAEHVHNWILMASAEEDRRFFVAGYCYYERLAEERKSIIGDILDDKNMDGAKGKLVIAMNTDKSHYPYSLLGSWLSAELFDNKFLKMTKPQTD